jgi:hypothetical protein
MIVCDYLDDDVKNYLNGNNSSRMILTFFKEPFNEYKGSKVIFIDDILDDDDYKKIDIFVEKTINITKEIFSKYLEVDGYTLFDYLKLQVQRNLGKIYKFKYGIDKVLTRENKTVINYFSSETELLEWIKQDYRIENIINYQIKDKLKYKFIIKEYLKSSFFANYILDRIIIKLFKDYKYKSGNILWMGGRSYDSKLRNELEKNNKIFLLPQFSGGKLGFIKRKYKFDLLNLKNKEKFNKKWDYLKNQYEDGLNKIAFITSINKKILEIILKINKSMIKDLLLTLIILEDNKNNIDLLIVEQSVIGKQALAVDFFNKNKLPSIEILHGVPGVVEVGKTDKIAVYGKRDKSFLSSYGIDESKIKITGCAYYDRIFNIKDEEKKYNFLLLILDWIDYVPSKNSHEIIYKQVAMMLKLLQHFQNEKLIIKLHPGQSMKEVEYIKHLIKNIMHIENRVELVKDTNVFNLLKDAKIVYNYCSSVGVEALLMKKPLIVLDFFSHRPIDYEKYEGCLVAKNYKELLLSTEEILKDVLGYLKKNRENIEKTRQYFSGDLKGESYKKVVKEINKMLYK